MSKKMEKVFVHSSQFPEQVYRDYLAGFSSKQINHKFHYDSVKQSQKWLKIHEKYSPSRNNEDCIYAYKKCFEKARKLLGDNRHIQLIGLGSGGGTKDNLFVSYLSQKHLTYYPLDVSMSLSLISAQKVGMSFPDVSIQPIVCDLLHAGDLMYHIDQEQEPSVRIITFFGMIPNFYPGEILPILSNFLQQEDILLFSANLAPGNDYGKGIETILPQYNNDLTKDWLITVLTDVGVNPDDGIIKFEIEPDQEYPDVHRITAYFELKRDVSFKLDRNLIQWQVGERVCLFFSYRYTTPMIQNVLNHYQIDVLASVEAANQEEEVYLCRKRILRDKY